MAVRTVLSVIMKILLVTGHVGMHIFIPLHNRVVEWLHEGSVLYLCTLGWSGGAMVPGKLPVPGRPTNLDNSGARAYCTCSRCMGGGCLGIFSLMYPISPLSPSLWETARYRLEYCLKGLLNPK